MARNHRAGWVMATLAVLVTALATLGFTTRHLELNLGPGDSPFVSGFEADSDVENKVGWHWTTYAAQVALPFEASGSAVDLTLRYARMFGEEAVVDVAVSGVRGEAFRARGGEVRSTTMEAQGVSGPLVVTIKVDSHERRNMGLRMDRLSIQIPSGPPLRLRVAAALRPILAALLLFAGLWILSGSPNISGALTLTFAIAFAGRAADDLFGAWRQVRLAPEMLLISTGILFLTGKWMRRQIPDSGQVIGWLSSAALVTMLFRLSLIFHPDFYYPDLLTHARVVDTIRDVGPSFFLNPAEALNAQGAWTKPVLGSVSSLPYAVMFHAPFAVLAALLDLTTDGIETALKAGSALISVAPVLLGGLLAARFSLPPEAALLLCVIPTYASRLSFALLPALFGHVFDLLVLLTIATRLGLDGLKSRRSMFLVMAALLVGHLSYTSSLVNEAVLVSCLTVLWVSGGRTQAPVGARLMTAEAGAALGAFLLYYQAFVGDVFGLATRILGFGNSAAGPATSVYPVESFFGLLFERTHTFFGWPWVGLAVLGLFMAGPSAHRLKILPAWFLSYLVLILLRAKVPDVFRYGHETLFVTPLVAILSGSALVLGWRRGGVWRAASAVTAACLLLLSLKEQWNAIREQLGNAR